MAIVLGTNSGFVTTAPTSDPLGTSGDVGATSFTMKDTTGITGLIRVTEIGWWCDNAVTDTNFEVGIYAADGGVVPGEAGTLLFVDRTNAKGADAGWKTVSVDWTLSEGTAYWLGVQVDTTLTQSKSDSSASGGSGADLIGSQSTLPDPFGGGALDSATKMYAMYALVSITSAGQNSAPYVY